MNLADKALSEGVELFKLGKYQQAYNFFEKLEKTNEKDAAGLVLRRLELWPGQWRLGRDGDNDEPDQEGGRMREGGIAQILGDRRLFP